MHLEVSRDARGEALASWQHRTSDWHILKQIGLNTCFDVWAEVMKSIRAFFLRCFSISILVALLATTLPPAFAEFTRDDCKICKDVLQVKLDL